MRVARWVFVCLSYLLCAALAVAQVVIDAGHGGDDAGAIGFWHEEMVFEKDFTLAASLSLAQALQTRGIYAQLIRSGDDTISLSERVAQAERHCRGGLFVSLHVDAFAKPHPSLAGIRLFSLDDRGIRQMLIRQHNTSKHVLKAYRHSAERAAALIIGYWHDAGWAHSAKIQRRHFRILHNASCPALLLELGLMSNEGDMAWLIDPEQLAQRMDGLAQAIDHYLQSEKESL